MRMRKVIVNTEPANSAMKAYTSATTTSVKIGKYCRPVQKSHTTSKSTHII